MSKIKYLLNKILRKRSKSGTQTPIDDEQVKDEDWGIQMAKLYRDELHDNLEYWEVKTDTDKKRYK